jgi:FkbH-like protein
VDALCVAVAASFTADPIDESLRHWWDELGVRARVTFAAYNQVFQALLDGDGPLATNRHGANVLLVRLDRWRDAEADDLAAAVRHSADRAPVPHLVVCCPGDAAEAADARLASALSADPRVRVVTSADLAALYPVAAPFDGYGERSADVPYTRAMFAALGTVVARSVHAWLAPRPKVIAVDADNTLWDGVVGEDGPLGVRVPAARRALQELLLAQRAAGRLIAICSKNAEPDVLSALATHPDMALRPEHVTAHRIDWAPKPANLAALAADLDLGLDSFVFLDDNPVEVAEMRAAHPEVLALALPADAAAALTYLRHCWPLDHAGVTSDDRERAGRYAVDAHRRAALTEAPSMASFLDSLELVVEVRPMAPADLARTAQLTQRTNQFNLTTVRRTAAELSALDGGVLVVDVRDRFGSYGQVGVVVHSVRGSRLDVETLLLSCRVLGRGVEHRVLAALGALAQERDLPEVALAYAPTDRNRPAYDFLTGLPGARPEGGSFVLSTVDALAARYEPPAGPPAVPPAPVADAVAAPPAAPADAERVHRIASGLTTAAQVLAAIDGRRDAGADPVPAGDPTEARVAAIWAELLDFPPVSVHDDFHELGGHSLALVRFAVRVRDEFGVELPVDALFTDTFTVAGIARTIREYATDGLDDLFTELEQLSDDEVRALLDADR